MLKQVGVCVVVMEVFFYGFDQGCVVVFGFDIVVFINLFCDYFDYYGLMEVYVVVKVKLFVWLGLCCWVINLDDDFGC